MEARAAEEAAQVFKNKQRLDRLLGVVDKLQDEADQAEIAMQAARSREREVKRAASVRRGMRSANVQRLRPAHRRQ